MKTIEILSHTHVPSGAEDGATRTLYTGSVVELDDALAGQVVAAGRGMYADKGAKLVDTTKRHEADADKRAVAQASPEAGMAAIVAAAVKAAMAGPAAAA